MVTEKCGGAKRFYIFSKNDQILDISSLSWKFNLLCFTDNEGADSGEVNIVSLLFSGLQKPARCESVEGSDMETGGKLANDIYLYSSYFAVYVCSQWGHRNRFLPPIDPVEYGLATHACDFFTRVHLYSAPGVQMEYVCHLKAFVSADWDPLKQDHCLATVLQLYLLLALSTALL